MPGIPDVPLTNYAGWLLVSLVIMIVLRALVGSAWPGEASPRDHAVPAVLLGWTWLGSTLANLAFFGRPAAAAYGFVAMGVVVWPYLARLRGHRLAAQPA